METNAKTLIVDLRNKTVDRSIIWELTESKSEYRLRLKAGAVTVDKWSGTEPNGDEFDAAEFAILNTKGEIIERYLTYLSDNPQDYLLILSLHDAVRRQILNVDETIDVLIGEIAKMEPPPF